ncbi:unnamed protein product, partial [Ilex paraguariensis]
QREELMRTVSSVFDGKLNILLSLASLLCKLNILINNAAISLLKRATDHTAEDFSNVMNTNIEAPYHLSQLAYPMPKASGLGNIIFISSIAGVTGLPAISVYAASKGAINQLKKNLACELAKDNIRINTVAPGEDVEKSIAKMFVPMMARVPLRPIAEPNEISGLVAFLCLQTASYITGQVIVVDGGLTAAGY